MVALHVSPETFQGGRTDHHAGALEDFLMQQVEVCGFLHLLLHDCLRRLAEQFVQPRLSSRVLVDRSHRRMIIMNPSFPTAKIQKTIKTIKIPKTI